MTKLKLHTPDLTAANIAKLAELFPQCVTEIIAKNGEPQRAIDFDLLKQELSSAIVEGTQERYQLNWVGKKEALLTANAPIAKTLRPVRAESVNFDTTQNLYIEGDNLDALKLLQETYLNQIKMIYIDPPYNTGNDFIYADDFAEDTSDYLQRSNQKDERGNRLIANTESNGRFHSDWLSMMYARLRLARNLLRDDGVIFISIDDNEQANLKRLCDEVFGEDNFVACLVWEKKKKGTFLSNTVTNVKEYVLVFSKSKIVFNGLIGEINYEEETYPCINASNKKGIRTIPAGIVSKFREKNHFLPKGSVISVTTMELVLHSDLVIENSILSKDLVIEGNWRYQQELMTEYAKNHELYITQDLYLRRIVREPREKTLKDLLPRVGIDEKSTHKTINVNNLFADGWGSNEDGEEELRQILESKAIMDFPKPRKLVEKLIASIRDSETIILDFFSGSATTAHAIMDLNSEDNGNRKFILVQIPEPCDPKSEAYKAGYKTIADIGKERIRRAGQQIKAKNALAHPDLDIGFRVLKIDSSNMNDVYYYPNQIQQADLLHLVNNIKPDRSGEDLLFQVLLDWGVDLTLPITAKIIDKKTIFHVADNEIIACFDRHGGITEDFIQQLATNKPKRVVFCDAGFADDSVKINVEQIFKSLSPHTEIKTI